MSEIAEQAVATPRRGRARESAPRRVEMRRYPRVEVRTDVKLVTPDRDAVKVRMSTLSAEGMQIVCDPKTARKLHPKGTPIEDEDGAEVKVRFKLDTADGRAEFSARARLRYFTALNRDEIAFGMMFTKVDLETKKRLTEYLIECMRPAE